MNGTPIWACALPDCNHYMPKHMEAMIPGKATYCWQCGEATIMDAESMKENQPRCMNCRTGIDTSSISEYLAQHGI